MPLCDVRLRHLIKGIICFSILVAHLRALHLREEEKKRIPIELQILIEIFNNVIYLGICLK